ncbi:MAG: bifunctional hydroxymethylpyrimidine kinase/phosphomethylpyrimidine kinase [Verrucomicrobiae bacterium]|nr:bifunctional hydroxymethylpyrimidine kinase/phosphomethylpyrimidine kinase [Verrucomicrobiae bacterium]
MRPARIQPVALTIAGSDSGGGAGIQADLKTFHAIGVFGTSAITCITAQNPDGVSAVQPIRPDIVAEQIAQVAHAFPIAAAKTGMLYNAPIIRAVADALQHHRTRWLVVDPVMVATSGAVLLKPDAIHALTKLLFPLATLVTPNLAELEKLTGRSIRDPAGLRDAARALGEQHGVAVLAKAGHLPYRGFVTDVLWTPTGIHEFRSAFVPRIRPHGAGCTYSAAIAAYLALGKDLADAVAAAKKIIQRALRQPIHLAKHRALRV